MYLRAPKERTNDLRCFVVAQNRASFVQIRGWEVPFDPPPSLRAPMVSFFAQISTSASCHQRPLARMVEFVWINLEATCANVLELSLAGDAIGVSITCQGTENKLYPIHLFHFFFKVVGVRGTGISFSQHPRSISQLILEVRIWLSVKTKVKISRVPGENTLLFTWDGFLLSYLVKDLVECAHFCWWDMCFSSERSLFCRIDHWIGHYSAESTAMVE